MAIVVREAIQYYDAFLCSPQHEVLVVILRVFQVMADKAIAALVQILDVIDSPRRPKIFAFQRVITSIEKEVPKVVDHFFTLVHVRHFSSL